ncbi:hypothetical protein [Nocardia sp. CNY236]|uniref:hypothetical protein n=1 Tax=Nocardia sp. CNY236 TaxID=1169152 RepID=UPI0018C9253E|nr:hypothetical protein [Nocardia sp. CNY236]
MVVTTWWRAGVFIVAALVVLVGVGHPATAQPDPSTPPTAPSTPADSAPSTTYGFDETCNEVHDTLSSIPALGSFLGDASSAVCKVGNVATHPDKALEATTSKLWASTVGQMTEVFLHGLGEAIALSIMWAQIPNDRILDDPGTGGDTLWQRVDSYTRQLQVWLLAFSIVVSAMRIGIARHNMAADHAEEAFRMMARATATTWIAGFAVLAGARLTDAFSLWVINDSTNGNARGAAELLVRTDRFGVYGPGLVFIVTIVGICGAVAMTVLTIIRQALLVVAAAIYPLTAAASGMSGGRQSFHRISAWIIAFLLFKPVAALVYMIAFVTADTINTTVDSQRGMDSAHRALVGIVLLCSVAFILPALVRLVAPALAAVGSGGSGAAATGAAVGVGIAALTGGKSLLGRGAVAGGAGSAGFVSGGAGPPTGHAGLARLGPGTGPGGGGGSGGGGSPKPLPGPRGASAASKPAVTQSAPSSSGSGSGSGSGTGSGERAARSAGASAATGAGRAADRIGSDTAGGGEGTESTGTAPFRGPDLGRHDIPR